MNLVTRIELPATFLASACSCAYDSAEQMGEPGEGSERHAAVEVLVLRGARELHAKGEE